MWLTRIFRFLVGEIVEVVAAIILFVSVIGAFYDGRPLWWVAFIVSLGAIIYAILRKKKRSTKSDEADHDAD